MRSPLVSSNTNHTSINQGIQEKVLIESNTFKGSLTQFLDAIKKHKIAIEEINLFPICSSYVTYILENKSLPAEESMLLISILSYLLEKKSSYLLQTPLDDDIEDVIPMKHALQESELIEIVSLIEDLYSTGTNYFYQELSDDDFHHYQKKCDMQLNPKILEKLLWNMLHKAMNPIPKILTKQRRSLKQMIKLVHASLQSDFKTLHSIIGFQYTKEECVWWILSILELIKEGKAIVQIDENDVYFAKS